MSSGGELTEAKRLCTVRVPAAFGSGGGVTGLSPRSSREPKGQNGVFSSCRTAALRYSLPPDQRIPLGALQAAGEYASRDAQADRCGRS